jgi:O-antigen/teichoic acid export membrane protein
MALLCWFAFRALKSHGLKVDFRNALSERGVFKAYSLAVMLTTVVTVASQYVIFALLSRSTDGAEATGRFMAAFQYRLVIQYMPMMIQATTGPIIAELLGAGQRDRAGRLFYQILGVVSLGLSVLSLILVEFSPQLLGLFGRGFQASPLLFASVMAYAATVAGNWLASMALQMHGKPWIAFRADVLAAMVLVISGPLLIHRYEEVGAAFALLIASIAQSVFYMMSTRDVGPRTRRSIGGIRYAALIMLAPQLCLLPALASNGVRGPLFLLASAAAVGIVIWSSVGWYRRVRASTVLPA